MVILETVLTGDLVEVGQCPGVWRMMARRQPTSDQPPPDILTLGPHGQRDRSPTGLQSGQIVFLADPINPCVQNKPLVDASLRCHLPPPPLPPQLVLNTSPAVPENCLSPLNAKVFKLTSQHLVLVMVVKKSELAWHINSWLNYFYF